MLINGIIEERIRTLGNDRSTTVIQIGTTDNSINIFHGAPGRHPFGGILSMVGVDNSIRRLLGTLSGMNGGVPGMGQAMTFDQLMQYIMDHDLKFK